VLMIKNPLARTQTSLKIFSLTPLNHLGQAFPFDFLFPFCYFFKKLERDFYSQHRCFPLVGKYFTSF